MSTHRGRKPSTKPGAAHLSALQTAHGKGDFHGAKVAALNYAKECTKHGNAKEEAEFHGDMTMGDPMRMVQPGPPMSAKGPSTPKPSQPPPDRKAQLAKLAMARGRKS